VTHCPESAGAHCSGMDPPELNRSACQRQHNIRVEAIQVAEIFGFDAILGLVHSAFRREMGATAWAARLLEAVVARVFHAETVIACRDDVRLLPVKQGMNEGESARTDREAQRRSTRGFEWCARTFSTSQHRLQSSGGYAEPSGATIVPVAPQGVTSKTYITKKLAKRELNFSHACMLLNMLLISS
jgi:hypothetical protein